MSDFAPKAATPPAVTIIGAGPVGLFTVFACGMLGLSCHVVDALPDTGGQCRALYPDKPIYDIPAFASVSGGALIDNLLAQAKPFAPTFHLGQKITALRGDVASGFTLVTDQNTTLTARAVIIAGGNGSFAPQKPPLADLDQYENTSIFYTVLDRSVFAGKRVVIAGGGDTAVDWALLLETLAAKVTLVHRRDKFRAAPVSVNRLHELVTKGRIDLKVPWQLCGLEGTAPHLESVMVEGNDGQRESIATDILLPCFGIAAQLEAIGEWGLELMRNQITVDQGTSQSSIPGIYAVGDIAHYPHKLKLIATGFTEAIQAAHAIYAQLNPDKPLHFVHSTDKGLPGQAA